MDLDRLRDRHREALDAFMRGRGFESVIELWSHRDDVTLANPLGAPVKGYDAVREASAAAAAVTPGGEGGTLETLSFVETPDLAYELFIQRGRVKLGTSDEIVPIALRVTTVFRREEDGWKIVHRHADPLTERSAESLGATNTDANR